MYISDEYFKELVQIINDFSQGNFNFDEEKLKTLYIENNELTNALIMFKKNQTEHINDAITILNSFINGDYSSIPIIHDNDYSAIYKKYNQLSEQLDLISKNINDIQKFIIKNGIIKSSLNTSELTGKWLYNANNLNTILNYCATIFNQIIRVLHNVEHGNLNTKINEKNLSGDFLYLAQTINKMTKKLKEIDMENNLQKERLEMLSHTDALTGIYNRGYFNKIVPNILNTAKRNDAMISFAIIDIDLFKNINDTYGHLAGDKVLKNIASIIKRHITRKNDYYFRIGGEEFAIIFSANDKKKAFDFMNIIREDVSKIVTVTDDGEIIDHITISIGLTSKRAKEIQSLSSLFSETDHLLYKAKETGRNKIVQN